MGIFFQFFDDFFFSESGISIINDFSESTGEENGNKKCDFEHFVGCLDGLNVTK